MYNLLPDDFTFRLASFKDYFHTQCQPVSVELVTFFEYKSHELRNSIFAFSNNVSMFVHPLEDVIVSPHRRYMMCIPPVVTFPPKIFHARQITGARCIIHWCRGLTTRTCDPRRFFFHNT